MRPEEVRLRKEAVGAPIPAGEGPVFSACVAPPGTPKGAGATWLNRGICVFLLLSQQPLQGPQITGDPQPPVSYPRLSGEPDRGLPVISAAPVSGLPCQAPPGPAVHLSWALPTAPSRQRETRLRGACWASPGVTVTPGTGAG